MCNKQLLRVSVVPSVASDLHSGGREVCHTAERITTLLHQMTATHDSELRLLRESLQRQREDSERVRK